METQSEIINQFLALAAQGPAPLQREAKMVVHKMTYPMKDILAKVPGTSVTERAKKVRVSRQTMYVWASEKFRPTRVQAKRIAKVTGVPIEHIIDDGFEHERARKKARKAAPGVAERRRKPKTPHQRASSKGRGEAAPRKRAKPVNDLHRPTG